MMHRKEFSKKLLFLLLPIAFLLAGCATPKILSVNEYRQSDGVQAECAHLKSEKPDAYTLCVKTEAKKQLESDQLKQDRFWKPIWITALIAGSVIFPILLNIFLVF